MPQLGRPGEEEACWCDTLATVADFGCLLVYFEVAHCENNQNATLWIQLHKRCSLSGLFLSVDNTDHSHDQYYLGVEGWRIAANVLPANRAIWGILMQVDIWAIDIDIRAFWHLGCSYTYHTVAKNSPYFSYWTCYNELHSVIKMSPSPVYCMNWINCLSFFILTSPCVSFHHLAHPSSAHCSNTFYAFNSS